MHWLELITVHVRISNIYHITVQLTLITITEQRGAQVPYMAEATTSVKGGACCQIIRAGRYIWPTGASNRVEIPPFLASPDNTS